MAVSVVELEKSLNALKEAFDRLKTRKDEVDYKINRDSCIQRFEFCIELAWRISVKHLGLNVSAPKPAIRELARAGLINNVEDWFAFLEARNKSSHTYDENIAKEVLEYALKFIPYAEELLLKIKTT